MPTQDENLDLITRYLNDPDNFLLEQEVQVFRASSAENEVFFVEIEKIWRDAEAAAVLNEIRPAASAKQFRKRLTEETYPRKSRLMLWLKGTAASFLILAGAYWMYLQNQKPRYLYKITGDVIDSIKLADGSVVTLAKHSELMYPDKFDADRREIALNKGQAFFKIAKDKSRPFTVTMNTSNVTVLGTSFNIKLSDSTIVLGVMTGRVLFSPYKDGVSSLLTAGQALTYDKVRKEFTAKGIQNEDAWLTRKLVFVDTPLEEVCKQLSAYYGVEIRLQDNFHTSKKLNANFKDQQLDEVLDVLKEMYNIDIHKERNQINLITPKQPN